MIKLTFILEKVNSLYQTIDSKIPSWVIELLISMLKVIVHILENHQKPY